MPQRGPAWWPAPQEMAWAAAWAWVPAAVRETPRVPWATPTAIRKAQPRSGWPERRLGMRAVMGPQVAPCVPPQKVPAQACEPGRSSQAGQPEAQRRKLSETGGGPCASLRWTYPHCSPRRVPEQRKAPPSQAAVGCLCRQTVSHRHLLNNASSLTSAGLGDIIVSHGIGT